MLTIFRRRFKNFLRSAFGEKAELVAVSWISFQDSEMTGREKSKIEN